MVYSPLRDMAKLQRAFARQVKRKRFKNADEFCDFLMGAAEEISKESEKEKKAAAAAAKAAKEPAAAAGKKTG